MEAKTVKKIPDGLHKGCEITRIDERTEPYSYIDFYVIVDEVEIKDGCPTNLSYDEAGNPQSKLAQRLALFGMEIVPGTNIELSDIQKHFKGLKANVMTTNEEVQGKGTFARIVSMKPTS